MQKRVRIGEGRNTVIRGNLLPETRRQSKHTACTEMQFAECMRNRSEEMQPVKLLRTWVRKGHRKLFAADIFC